MVVVWARQLRQLASVRTVLMLMVMRVLPRSTTAVAIVPSQCS